MKPASATLVSDGSPESAALATWLRSKVEGLRLVQTGGPDDVGRVVDAFRANERTTRLVAISTAAVSSDVDAHRALEAVRRWLRDVAPIDARARGPRSIDDALDASVEGADDVRALARRLSPSKPKDLPVPKKRGRPKGQRDPFRGVGFEVCFALLRHPDRVFTERGLSELTGRSQFGVHRVLLELDERGFLRRGESGSELASRVALRDALAEGWRARVGISRRGQYFAAPPGAGRDAHERALDALRTRGIEPVLAAGSAAALGNGVSIVDAGLTVYGPDDAADALQSAGFRHTRSANSAVVVWPVVEPSVLTHPRIVDGRAATHPIITYLDLLASSDERERSLAHEIDPE